MTNTLIEIARKLRRNMTDAERRLWSRLRDRQLGANFRRQAPLEKYVLDFVCFSERLVIEVDGGQHADSAADKIRDAWMTGQGFRTLRFWNNDVLENTDGVVETILAELKNSPRPSSPPQPSPVKGERVQSPPPRPSPIEGEGVQSLPPRPSPVEGEGVESPPPQSSPIEGEGDARSAMTTPSPLAGEGWGGGR